VRPKTSIVIGFLLAVLVLVVTVAATNRPVLEMPFRVLWLILPTSWVLLLALCVGFLSFAVWLFASGVSQASRRWLARLRSFGERDAEERYLKGLDAVLGGRPLEAVRHFQGALESKPDYLPALLKLGDSFRALGRIEEAAVAHRRALTGHPEDIPTLYALTEDALAAKKHDEAKKCLQEILRIQPRRALKALRTLRDLYIREGNWTRALEVQERIGEARVLEEERVQDAPFTSGILYQIGVDLLQQDKPRDAALQFQKVRKKYSAFVPTYLRMAECHLLLGQEREAVEAYLDGYNSAASADCLLAMEHLFLEKGVPEEAVRHYQTIIASTTRTTLPRFLLGRLYYRLEMLDKADALFREIEGDIGESGLLQYYRGRIRERSGDPAAACGHYRRLLRLLNPFELTYRCGGCGDKSPEWKDFCPACLAWDTYQADFKDELLQEIQESRPVYYREDAWPNAAEDPSS
jgi:tetratricopeptide (TPR) repeat protein